jgi:hypothetical protein
MAITAYVKVFAIDRVISELTKTACQAEVVNRESMFIVLNAIARTGTIANAVALETIDVATIFSLRVLRGIWRVIVGLVG